MFGAADVVSAEVGPGIHRLRVVETEFEAAGEYAAQADVQVALFDEAVGKSGLERLVAGSALDISA